MSLRLSIMKEECVCEYNLERWLLIKYVVWALLIMIK